MLTICYPLQEVRVSFWSLLSGMLAALLSASWSYQISVDLCTSSTSSATQGPDITAVERYADSALPLDGREFVCRLAEPCAFTIYWLPVRRMRSRRLRAFFPLFPFTYDLLFAINLVLHAVTTLYFAICSWFESSGLHELQSRGDLKWSLPSA